VENGLPLLIPVAGAYDVSYSGVDPGNTDIELAGAVAQQIAAEHAGQSVLLEVDARELETALRAALDDAGVPIATTRTDAGLLLLATDYEETARLLTAGGALPAILVNDLYFPLIESLIGDAPVGPLTGWRAQFKEEAAGFREPFAVQAGRPPGHHASMAYHTARCLLDAANAAPRQTRAGVTEALAITPACNRPMEIEFIPLRP
jgi:hypothetical protein